MADKQQRIVLKGITWGHTRGYAPLAVTSQIYRDYHPEVSIEWEQRSLWSFGEEAIEEVVKNYDFVLVDHPFMGVAEAKNIFLSLEKHYPVSVLNELKSNSLGASYNSYVYNNHLWALPVDAASQVSVARPDLLKNAGLSLPKTWDEVILLARETGKVAMPMAPMGLLGAFFTICANQGEAPFAAGSSIVVSDETGLRSLDILKQLFQYNVKDCLQMYPTNLLNRMTLTDEIIYIPCAYGYVNYSMPGYGKHLLSFHNIPTFIGGKPHGATLGGVGIAISSATKNIDIALDYSKWIASEQCQRTIYAYSGGQPADINAWKDKTLNALCNNFYNNTLETVENAFVRPRYNGFHHFQSQAAAELQRFLREGLEPLQILKFFNSLYLNSQKHEA